ncbi:hypothetical protein E2P84_36610 [Burkholderia cepacia]|uniref:Uncharacterized protein n=1 Tax=Burkholderia cepacia TaxID=292 RepID=A0AAX2RN70_BURCE|nr:hypothetical protein [Burkholderia cepacia]TES65653.1 hypothetical protein E2P84_36610 [Burkholderia cepacia]TET01691.1 hypothetical protein E3D36_16785 [Burkholderia cepacia]TEU47549.1 hypothetical protein E3D37_16215 [Burkholderia cepacia]TEU53576.1 hypothetical protein E3D38_12605 [Burkholderia cepacia]TEV02182.1 hypothetical protein E3D40_13535 [Burkholderia cepacia]
MFKTVKQSLVDWQVTKDGAPFAWITNNKGSRMYTVTFHGCTDEYSGYRNLAAAKKFATGF